ncbi:MAG: hypothetical protein AW09_003853 [Candidatus Accumulibacter phosphatis]|uniref:Uncharacterized protein n=1 Tax=Candidatus Accumulibacter phosphatis TaxID=327160 RepID=A0A080LRY0_9PROT|nr:MAG: hypothetical protein AW09_003853 [Candidatus Accumulibacter phosphatis]
MQLRIDIDPLAGVGQIEHPAIGARATCDTAGHGPVQAGLRHLQRIQGSAQVGIGRGSCQRVLEAIRRLGMKVRQVAESQQTPGTDEDPRLSFEFSQFGTRRDRLRIPPRVLRGPQQRSLQTIGIEIVIDVETPDIAQHIHPVHPQRSVVEQRVIHKIIDLVESAWRRGIADTGGDLGDQLAGGGIEHVQITVAIAGLGGAVDIVQAGGHEDHPGAILELRDDRAAEGVAEMAVGPYPGSHAIPAGIAPAELPQGFRNCRIGHVQGVITLAALVESADQNRFPGGTCIDVPHRWRTIDVELVSIGVVVVRQLEEIGQNQSRNECPGLLSGRRDEGMQHAIVGADIEHRRTPGMVALECCIAAIRVGGEWPLDESRLGVHEVTQNMGAGAVEFRQIIGRE